MAQTCETQHGAPRRQGFLLMSGLTLLLVVPSAVEAQQPADFFRQNCMSCHTIGGGRLGGPDLKDVTKRKNRRWLVRFLLDPEGMVERKDAYALKLQQEAEGMLMPNVPGMTPSLAEGLLDFIEAESKSGQTLQSKPPISEKPTTAAEAVTERTVPAGMLSPTSGVPPQEIATYFRQNCSSCHTVGGGRLTGPDLKDVTKRRNRAWLKEFISNPKAMMDRSDAYALNLLQAARGVVMPPAQGMTDSRLDALLNFIEEQSKSGGPALEGAISDRPYTAADLLEGRALFLGTKPLARGGPPCISCHTLGTIRGLGGGRLGPDLTRVYERLGGRKAVGAWLSAPPTPTMQAVFKQRPLLPEESFALLAGVEDASSKGHLADSAPVLKFFLLGFGGMSLGLILLQVAWRGRLRAVRRPLVHGRERGEP